jgi:DNA-binding MarR family transcriptional regulator
MTSPTPPPDGDESGRFAFDGLDRVLHEKARLGILASLLAHRDGVTFTELKDLCALTDGNLSRHLTALKEAELVVVQKGTAGRRPQTRVKLAAAGKKRFLEYLAVLEGIVTDALATATPPAADVQLKPA